MEKDLILVDVRTMEIDVFAIGLHLSILSFGEWVYVELSIMFIHSGLL